MPFSLPRIPFKGFCSRLMFFIITGATWGCCCLKMPQVDRVDTQLVMTMYTYNDLSFEQLQCDGSCDFEISENAVLRKGKSKITIIPLNAQDIQLKVSSAKHHQGYQISVNPNPHFNPAWTQLPLDSIPTPLKKEQAHSRPQQHRLPTIFS